MIIMMNDTIKDSILLLLQQVLIREQNKVSIKDIELVIDNIKKL